MIKKSILKSKLLSDLVKTSAKRECAIHSKLKHKNIIELYDYTENDDELALFMEYANKPFYLNDLIVESHTPIEDEVELKKYAHDILEGIRYLHSQGIIHADIKLENMLCHEEDDVTTVKICDLGFSHIIDPNKGGKVVIHDVSGTVGHIAPEVKSHCSIGTEVDIWCFGLMLYEMTVAYKPTQVKKFSYADEDIPFRKYDWRRKNPEIKDLILKCMKYNPQERITADEALQHPWFTQGQ